MFSDPRTFLLLWIRKDDELLVDKKNDNQNKRVRQREERVILYLETASGRRNTPSSLAEEALSAAATSLLPSSVIESEKVQKFVLEMLKIIKNYCLLLEAVQDRGIYLSMVSKRESVMFAVPPKTLGSDKSVLNSVFPQINLVDCVRNDTMLFCDEPAQIF